MTPPPAYGDAFALLEQRHVDDLNQSVRALTVQVTQLASIIRELVKLLEPPPQAIPFPRTPTKEI